MTNAAPTREEPTSIADGDDATRVCSGDGATLDVATPADALRLLHDDETVLLLIRPHPLFVVLDGAALSTAIIVAITLATWAGALVARPVPWDARQALVLGSGVVALRLVWKLLDWANRLYLLTDRRVLRRRGVILLSIVEAPLPQVQNSALFTRLRERLTGTGTVGFATAGTGAFEIVWEMVSRPVEVQRIAAEAIERYGRHGRR